MSNGFQKVLEHIRSISGTESGKGRLFERLMKAYFEKDVFYRDRFSRVWLWSEWAEEHSGFEKKDEGIDIVAEESEGGYCAIQCKFHGPKTRIGKPAIDSFVTASAREPFTERIIVDTGDDWGPGASRAIRGLRPKCSVIRFGDLADRPFDWPDLIREAPEALSSRLERFSLLPHQQRAFDAVVREFKNYDRGKLIMACGTGKTFTALRIAEKIAGLGGRVLYLVPSISLFQQTMREWKDQCEIPLRYIGICSDTKAGHDEEDTLFEELEIPVTTNQDDIEKKLRAEVSEKMTVVFCTYHSLGLIEEVQAKGAPAFDLILCDEAHRTTGIEHPEDNKTSPFVLVHDGARILGEKRLYMTATPRLYTKGAKSKAARHNIEVFSMDDEATYGPRFHRLTFSQAVEQNLLSDYKVVVFALSISTVNEALPAHIVLPEGIIDLSDAAQIVGCWRVLQDPENLRSKGEAPRPLQRAIAFTRTIKSSQLLASHWEGIIKEAVVSLPEAERKNALQCETRHVDGKHNAFSRKARIDWLKESSEKPDGACRILSNARCLSEGIDVPALDAVIFMTERKSTVDIVQAVGRVMRKAEGKKYGYIVLPIAVPAGSEPASVLDTSDKFDVVWSVLRALRSHDDRLDAKINKIDLNQKLPDQIIFNDNGNGENGETGEEERRFNFSFSPLDFPPNAIYAKIVEKCGDKKYWEDWAKDVADIFARLVDQIDELLINPENETLKEWFEAFHGELKSSINDSITKQSAIDMMAQHILTRPVFDALFENYDFAGGNPVARALDALQKDFGEFGLENETRDLKPFYESVQLRARDLNSSKARQQVLMELYENFFKTAMKKDTDRLGIAYTNVDVVDFILASADHIVRTEFGFERGLSDKGVQVLDPFTGTGIFLVRLLQSRLIHDADLIRKYREELHANEIVLLAYYIAAIHIEETFRGRLDNAGPYEPFGGIVLADTFNLHTEREGFPKDWLPDNSARAERQQKLPIQVIVSNPPWSAGQKSVSEQNPNVDYPELEKRIAETYAVHSKVTNKAGLYDSYKMALRWASDRIGDRGVVAFVTNGSWLDSNVDSGVRACFAEEFSSVYVLNLRGNKRTSGEDSRREGEGVFGQSTRATVAITLLVKNPNASHKGCRIRYRDIGNYLKRKEKLAKLRNWKSIAGIEDWEDIAPDQHHDWIGKRNEAFSTLYALGSKDAKSGKTEEVIFELFSNGYKTGRDSYVYNFSRQTLAENTPKMVADYCNALQELLKNKKTDNIDELIQKHSSNLLWDREQKLRLQRKVAAYFSKDFIRPVAYRPFIKQHFYADPVFSQMPYQNRKIFPAPDTENQAICISGTGATTVFSAHIVDVLPDLNILPAGAQCFPRYRYERESEGQQTLELADQPLKRIDNITDMALRAFRVQYADNTISKDTIFDYVYGILHAPEYRERFADNLKKQFPRIPFAEDFRAFANAGRALAELHLGYESCEEYPLAAVFPSLQGDPDSEHYRIGERKMRFENDKKSLMVNDHLRLEGIPPEAHEYIVNGKTPLEWFINRYQIKQDQKSGIINDPNGWFPDPRELVSAFRRIVHVSMQTVAIVKSLPSPFAE